MNAIDAILVSAVVLIAALALVRMTLGSRKRTGCGKGCCPTAPSSAKAPGKKRP
jgi:hypothetical protein